MRDHVARQGTTYTVAGYLRDRWLPLQESRLRPTTLRSYESKIELHVVPHIGRIELDELTVDHLDGLYISLLRSGRRNGSGGGLSPTSVRYVHRILSKALNDAQRKGLVARNVAEVADPPRANAARSSSAIQVWDAETLRRFLAVTADHRLHDLWTLAARTGMRRGELVGLQWRDVGESTVTVQRAAVLVGWKVELSDVKTRSGRRTIDLDQHTQDMLARRRRTLEAAGTATRASSFVFPGEGTAPRHPEYVSRAFGRQVARHGFDRIRFHDLRHTHATLLLKAGVPAKVVSERLGHSSPGFTLTVYQHVLPGMQAAAAKTFSDLLADP